MTESALELEIGYLVTGTIAELVVSGRRPWTMAEDAYLEENLGFQTDAEIGAALGRSEAAVHIRWTRELRLPAPSKHPDYLTGRGVARLLGCDDHQPASWIDRGLLPGHHMAGGREIRRVHKRDLDRFAVNPHNWIWFDHHAVPDRRLARLIALADERWGDEWWDTNQAAEYCGLANNNSITGAIRRGALPAVIAENYAGRHPDPHWCHWYLRRSDVVDWNERRLHGDDGRDRFLIEALAAGLTPAYISQLAGWSTAFYVTVKIKDLIRTGRLPDLVGDNAHLHWRKRDLQVWLDWRRLPGRFPRLELAITRAQAGSADQADWFVLRGLVRSWAAWHLGPQHTLTRGLTGGGRNVASLVRKTLLRLSERGVQVLDAIPPRPA